ncbi:MAG: hypothetical protein ABJZ55_01150 [Fuerstiella sp.]
MPRKLPYKTIVDTTGDSEIYAYLIQTNEENERNQRLKLFFYTKELNILDKWPVDYGQKHDYTVRHRVMLEQNKLYTITVSERTAGSKTYSLDASVTKPSTTVPNVDELTAICFGEENSPCFGQISLCPDPLVGECDGGSLHCIDEIN